MSPFERAARLEKAIKLAAAIDRVAVEQGLDPHKYAGAIARMARVYTDRTWRALATEAGVNPPSAATQAEVIRLYEERADEPSVTESGVYSRAS